jgi:hypothetical protein
VLDEEDCGFRKWSLNRVLAWDGRHRRLRPVAIQSAEGAAVAGRGVGAEAPRLLASGFAGGEVRLAGAAAEPLARLLLGAAPASVRLSHVSAVDRARLRFVAGHRGGFARLVGVDSSCQIRR